MVDPKDPAEGQPRVVNISARAAGSSRASASLSVWRRYEVLLDTAKELRDSGYNDAAIAIAQTACEVCTERVLTDAFTAKGIEYLAKPVDGFVSSYNLGSDRVRKLYTAVTGHNIHQDDTDRWRTFKEHVERRHAVVHRGHAATVEQADASIEAVEYIIGRLLGNSL
jgi:hypothetical protein